VVRNPSSAVFMVCSAVPWITSWRYTIRERHQLQWHDCRMRSSAYLQFHDYISNSGDRSSTIYHVMHSFRHKNQPRKAKTHQSPSIHLEQNVNKSRYSIALPKTCNCPKYLNANSTSIYGRRWQTPGSCYWNKSSILIKLSMMTIIIILSS